MEGSSALSKKRKDSDSLMKEKTVDIQAEKPNQHKRIAVAAYYKAEARGFQPGHDIEDWLTAEAEEQNAEFTY